MSEQDRFGGTARIHGEATGFFRIEEIDGRWWFITPDGHGFLSLAVNHIDSACLKYPDNVHVWNDRYGDERSFCENGVRYDLKDWGFNTVGWSQEVHVRQRTHTPPWRHDQYRWVGMPYCHAIPFTEIEMWNRHPRFPDVFTEEWGRTWAGRMDARFDGIPDAGHFLQSSHGPRVAELIIEGRSG